MCGLFAGLGLFYDEREGRGGFYDVRDLCVDVFVFCAASVVLGGEVSHNRLPASQLTVCSDSTFAPLLQEREGIVYSLLNSARCYRNGRAIDPGEKIIPE